MNRYAAASLASLAAGSKFLLTFMMFSNCMLSGGNFDSVLYLEEFRVKGSALSNN
jgi:hypothetical protein